MLFAIHIYLNRSFKVFIGHYGRTRRAVGVLM